VLISRTDASSWNCARVGKNYVKFPTPMLIIVRINPTFLCQKSPAAVSAANRCAQKKRVFKTFLGRWLETLRCNKQRFASAAWESKFSGGKCWGVELRKAPSEESGCDSSASRGPVESHQQFDLRTIVLQTDIWNAAATSWLAKVLYNSLRNWYFSAAKMSDLFSATQLKKSSWDSSNCIYSSQSIKTLNFQDKKKSVLHVYF